MGFSKIFDSQKGNKKIHKNRTICELHRELYDLCVLGLHEDNPELMHQIIGVLEDAFIMGVKMNKKLCKYKLGSSSKWNEKEYRNDKVDRQKVTKRRKERVKLEKMLTENNMILEKFGKYKK
jgi:hypothetical protein